MALRDSRADGEATVKELNRLMDEERLPEAVKLAGLPLPLPENSPLRTAEMAFFVEEGPQADATVAAARAAVIEGYQLIAAHKAEREHAANPSEKSIKPKEDYGYGERR